MSDFEAEFSWPFDASDVILTGSFDNWSRSIHLQKGVSGFAQRVSVPWNEKVPYKFIVDGIWVTRDDRPTEFDGAGNLNNVLFTPSKPAPSTMDHPPTPILPQVSIDSMPSATTLSEAPPLYSGTPQQEASKVDEGRGIIESDSTDRVADAVVDLVVPDKELATNVPDVTVEAVETAEPSTDSEDDPSSVTVDGATSLVANLNGEIATSLPNIGKEVTSAPECVSSITPSDPTDNVPDEIEQPLATSTPEISSTITEIPENVQGVPSPEIVDATPQIAPIIHFAILPVNDHTLNESASPSLEGELGPSVPHSSNAAISVPELSTHSPMRLSKAIPPTTQEIQAGEQNISNPNSEPTQEETLHAQVVEQEEGELLVDAAARPSDPDTNDSTLIVGVNPNSDEPTDTSAASAGPVIPKDEPSSLAPETQNASAVTAPSILPPTPALNGDTKLKDASITSSITTDSPVAPSSKFSTRKKRRSLFAKLKDFLVRDKTKK